MRYLRLLPGNRTEPVILAEAKPGDRLLAYVVKGSVWRRFRLEK